MRLLFWTDPPMSHSAYGKQYRLLSRALLADGHAVACAAATGLQYGALQSEYGTIYPLAYAGDGQDVLEMHARHFDADVVVSLKDIFHVDPSRLNGQRWLAYTPLEFEPLPAAHREHLRQAWALAGFSRWICRVLEGAGFDAPYLPLLVDTGVYRPGDRAVAREALGWPQDVWTLAIVAANAAIIDRKAFAEQLAAFATLRRRHADARLYLHTCAGMNAGGLDLDALCEHLGLTVGALAHGADVEFANQYRYATGRYDDASVARIYQATDAVSLVSKSEGLGMSLIEAQSCGTPVITGQWTGMAETVFPTLSYAVAAEDTQLGWLPMAARWYVPRVEAIAELYLEAYEALPPPSALRQAAHTWVAERWGAAEAYQAHWRPYLEALAERIALSERVLGKAVA